MPKKIGIKDDIAICVRHDESHVVNVNIAAVLRNTEMEGRQIRQVFCVAEIGAEPTIRHRPARPCIGGAERLVRQLRPKNLAKAPTLSR